MINKPPAVQETERLILRKPVKEDIVPVFELYAQDPQVTRYLTWRPHQTISQTEKFFRRCLRSWQDEETFPWSIIRKEDKQLLGMIEIISVDHAGLCIGYVLARKFWGNGYIVEALKCIVRWAFEQEHIYRVWAVCDVENRASMRVLEKAGMQKEGILRRWLRLPAFGQIPRDCVCYSIIKS